MNYSFIDILVTSILALMMFMLGLSIKSFQCMEVFSRPKAFIVAILSQMILLPLIAFCIATFFTENPIIQVGIVILAASPGGATSGFITYLFKGNTALSIILTGVNSFLTLFSIPFIVNLALVCYMNQSQTITLPFWETVFDILFITIIPAVIGMTFRLFWPSSTTTISKFAKPILLSLLLIVFIFKIVGSELHGETGLSVEDATYLLPYCLLLNVLCFFTGYFISGIFKIEYESRLTTAIESAVHNTTLAFLIAGALLNSSELCKPALVYAMISFWTAILYCFILQRRRRALANLTQQQIKV